MSASAKKLPELMTVDEFIAWPGDGTGLWYDLVDGRLRAHAAPNDLHATMHGTLAYLLIAHVREHLPFCRVAIGGGVRPRIKSNWNYRVPDITMTCSKNAKGQHDVPDPVVIIELLSPSNQADTWDNVRNYATVPSISDIVIIDTQRIHADVLTRDDKGHWPANPVEVQRGGVIALTSLKLGLKLVLALNNAYQNTYLAAA
jgi:Uma2 family endonuclease